MGQQYTYLTRWEENMLVVLHMYGTRAIFLIFCDHQDTEYESCEIEISISHPILNH